VFALVEQEGRVGGCHQCAVGDDADDPAVEPDDVVEEAARIVTVDGERDRGDEDEDADQPGEDRVLRCPDDTGAAAEDAGDQVLRDSGDPGSEQLLTGGLLFGVVDLEASGIVRSRSEREGRVAVGAEGAVAVEVDAPGPAPGRRG
jgi:hypothetical protein